MTGFGSEPENGDFPEEVRVTRYLPEGSKEWIRMWARAKALTAAARTTVDMDGEVTLQTAEKFEEWLLRDSDTDSR